LAVATHADDRNLTAAHKKKAGLLIDKLRETYPAQLRELFLVNARQGKGVDDVRNKLVDVAVDHFWLAQPVPKYAPPHHRTRATAHALAASLRACAHLVGRAGLERTWRYRRR
jgi:hypothetical protein